MPNRGDKLYKCWNGKLETVTFVEESIGAGYEGVLYGLTWVVRAQVNRDETTLPIRRRIRCSIGSYFTTEKAAWKAELASYKAGLKQQIKQRHELTAIIKETRQTIKELKGKVGIKPRLTNAELNSGWKSA
jgi:hypothetical protein